MIGNIGLNWVKGLYLQIKKILNTVDSFFNLGKPITVYSFDASPCQEKLSELFDP